MERLRKVLWGVAIGAGVCGTVAGIWYWATRKAPTPPLFSLPPDGVLTHSEIDAVVTNFIEKNARNTLISGPPRNAGMDAAAYGHMLRTTVDRFDVPYVVALLLEVSRKNAIKQIRHLLAGARADQIQASEKLVEEEINSNLRFNVFSSLCNRFVATLDVNGEGRCPKEDFIRKFLQASAPAALTGVTCASGYGYYGYGASASSNGVTFLF